MAALSSCKPRSVARPRGRLVKVEVKAALVSSGCEDKDMISSRESDGVALPPRTTVALGPWL